MGRCLLLKAVAHCPTVKMKREHKHKTILHFASNLGTFCISFIVQSDYTGRLQNSKILILSLDDLEELSFLMKNCRFLGKANMFDRGFFWTKVDFYQNPLSIKCPNNGKISCLHFVVGLGNLLWCKIHYLIIRIKILKIIQNKMVSLLLIIPHTSSPPILQKL